MILVAALLAASLIVPTAIDSGALSALPNQGPALSSHQKRAVLAPLISSATECVARTVSANPRFPAVVNPAEVNDLIVESIPSCLQVMRRMIETYDRLFGDGAGENFFMGPYLDALPAAVHKLVNGFR
jgi:hypothetical protein